MPKSSTTGHHTWNFLKREDAEIADYTAVIEAATAADEIRACALNNRADIYDRNSDAAAAIADRTAVLDLADTTYDRRYIAHARRPVTTPGHDGCRVRKGENGFRAALA